MSAPEYNEAAVLSDYLWRNYSHHATRFEYMALKAIPGELGVESLLSISEGNSAEVVDAVQNRNPEIRAVIMNRIVREHSTDIHVQRCTSCNRIVQSPKSQQCLWCGYDWHPTA